MQGWRTSMVFIFSVLFTINQFQHIFNFRHMADASAAMAFITKVVVCLAQEDAHVAMMNIEGHEDRALFGVFDGHGGAEVAKFCAAHLPKIFLRSEEYESGDMKKALMVACLEIDERLRDPVYAEELHTMKAKKTTENGDDHEQPAAVVTGT